MGSQSENIHLHNTKHTGAQRYLLDPNQVHFSIAPDYITSLQNDSEDFHVIGQPRALSAIRMAISIQAKGYNIFASGLPGTGKSTAITSLLSQYEPKESSIKDIAFAANFESEHEPRLLFFPKGTARMFQQRLREILIRLRSKSQELFKNKPFRDQRDSIIMSTEGKDNDLLKAFEARLAEHGFQLVRLMDQEESHPDIFPIIDGEAIDFETLQNKVQSEEISREDFQNLREQYFRFSDEMNQLFQEIHDNRINMEESIDTLRRDALRPIISSEMQELQDDWKDDKDIHDHIEAIKKDLESTLSEQEAGELSDAMCFIRYSLNIAVDNSATEKAPIISETNPDGAKIFGVVESPPENAETKPAHLLLQAGSLLQASGGFLILRAEDILQQEDVWNGLKRALQSNSTEIRHFPGPYGIPGPAIKSGNIPLNVKVILTGTEGLYEMLYNIDEDFQKLFKVPAEFDSVMPRNEQSIREYMGFVAMVCREEQLLPLTADGLAEIVTYGVRLAEHRNYLSTRFSLIADLLREANYWALQQDSKEISQKTVQRALDERTFFANLPEEKIDEQIESGELIIALQGTAIGRINGLAILDRGYYAFGRPMLISAGVSHGSEGIINIERESGLSGEIHDKGVYIIEGYLQTKYATDFPLNIRASIAFEQSYSEVDGDSASSTEIYVLLSAISKIPLRQDIAVSGSVNQNGDIQPVGGISEKIEGFFTICKKMGLSGKQGVVIPRRNIDTLILSQEVQEAVKNGFFHIYAIDRIDQGIEILTGMEAGVANKKGEYPASSLNGIIQKRLREMAYLIKDFGGS